MDMFMFNGFFCALLGVVSIFLKLKVEKGSEENKNDSVIPSIVLSALAYSVLATMWPMTLPHLDAESVRKPFMTLLIREVVSTIVVIFTTGPIKVWLDIKRGKTSVQELQENYEDQRGWLH